MDIYENIGKIKNLVENILAKFWVKLAIVRAEKLILLYADNRNIIYFLDF